MAAGYVLMKMKRKGVDEVNDDFSDFSLSSPARKIRRLDDDLPPILQEEVLKMPPTYQQSMVNKNAGQGGGGIVIEELPTLPENEERAIVLFKPMDNPLYQSPLNFSVSVSPNLISGLKSQVLWSSNSNLFETKDERTRQENNSGARDCLAVVPWVPSTRPSTTGAEISPIDVSDSTEAEEMDAVMMDVEDNNSVIEQNAGNEFSGVDVNDGLHQWQQQQHCMIPQPPQQASTPIVWYG